MQEARRKRLTRQAEAYNAALLPNQKGDAVRREMERIRLELYEIDNEDEIDAMEKLAAKRHAEMKAARKDRKVQVRRDRKTGRRR